MEPETQPTNPRQASTSNLPGITLTVLIALIIALLYIGYEGIADNTKGSEELTNVPLDTTDRQAGVAALEPELIAPEETDTSTAPVPVDLSQAPAPPDESVADAPATDAPTTTRTEKPEAAKTAENTKPATEKKPEVTVKVEKPKPEKPVEKPKVETPVAEKPVEKPKPVADEEPKKPVVTGEGVSTKYTVGAGETFYGIANRYNLKPSTLKELNPGVSESDVKSGITKLNVKVMAVHTVGPGDLLRVVAQKYGVSKEAIMKANKKSKDIATRGEKLIIPFPEKQ